MPTTVLSDDFFVPTTVARICAGTRAPGREPTSDMTVAASMSMNLCSDSHIRMIPKCTEVFLMTKMVQRCVSLYPANTFDLTVTVFPQNREKRYKQNVYVPNDSVIAKNGNFPV